MSTSIKWNACGSREVTTVARPRWRKLRQGLVLAGLGDILVLTFGLQALVLLGPLGVRVVTRLGLEAEDASLLGLTLAGLALLLGYVLALVGRWCCLIYAPQGHGAKDLQFACLLCTLIAPACFVLAHFLGGAETYAVFREDPVALVDIGLLQGGVVLQLTGLLVGLLGVLLFSGFTRAVRHCLRDEKTGRFFWFVAFLLGGTIGLVLEARRTHIPEIVEALAAAWLLCLLWHALLVRGTARRLAEFLRTHGSRVLPPGPGAPPRSGQVTLRTAL
jgi:hypothetical protein